MGLPYTFSTLNLTGYPKDAQGNYILPASALDENFTYVFSRLSAAAGSSGYVQFNKNGTLAGDSNFVWDDTNKRLRIGPSNLVNENYSGKTDLDYPPTKLSLIEGSQSSPITANECMTYFERHTASNTGDPNEYYNLSKFVSFLESGYSNHHAVGYFEFRNRSGNPNYDNVAVVMAGGATAANSGRGIYGGWVNLFDHPHSDFPGLCGIEINIVVNRAGLTGGPWSEKARTGIYAVSYGPEKPHSAFNAGKAWGQANWRTGLALKDCDIMIFGYTATDTNVDGIIKIRNHADTKDIFSVTNLGHMYINGQLFLSANDSDSGALHFGRDSDDYIAFNGNNFHFVCAGDVKLRIDNLGNTVCYGDLYTGGVSPLKVVGTRITGWGAPTGTKSRATFDTGTVTLDQLAARVGQLIDDLRTHGLIGA